MEKRKLGRTDLEVTRLSLGCLFMSSNGGDYEQSREGVFDALDKGVNFVDTAPSYANSEEVLGKILREYKGNMPYIATKIGLPPPFNPKSIDDIIASVEHSIEIIGCEKIDLLFVHEPERRYQMEWWDDEITYTGPVLKALDILKERGLVKWIGVGGTTAYEMARVIDTGIFDVVQQSFNYSLLWREAEHSIFEVAKKHNIGIVSSSPLNQGALAVRRDDIIENGAPWINKPRKEQFKALYKLLDETNMPIVEMAMRFVISNPDVDVVLTGSRSAAEFDQNWEYVEKGPLPKDILDELDKIYSMVPFRPTLEPILLPWGNEWPGLGWVR